jgi:predicted enzyme related to lactoylglutathione lyase
MPTPTVVQFEITGRDGDALSRFYARLFGWEMQETGTPGYYRVVANDMGISGAVGPSWDGGPGQVTVLVEVADLQETLSRAEALGGTRCGEPHEVPKAGLTFTYVTDPEGHVVGLAQGLQRALAQFESTRGESRATLAAVEFEITGHDGAALSRFYACLFGWQFHESTITPGVHLVAASEAGISGHTASSWDGGAGWLTIYVEVPDLHGRLALAAELGGTIIRPPHEIPPAGISFAFVADPEGHVVGLRERAPSLGR